MPTMTELKEHDEKGIKQFHEQIKSFRKQTQPRVHDRKNDRESETALAQSGARKMPEMPFLGKNQ